MTSEKEEKIKDIIDTLIARLHSGQCYAILNEFEWLNEWKRTSEEIPTCEYLHRKLTDEIMKVVNE